MASTQRKQSIDWLKADLEMRKDKTFSLLWRLRGVTARLGTAGLSLHKKFIRLVGQFAEGRQKELDLIYKIETLEKYHQELRQKKKLKRVAALYEKKNRNRLKREQDDIDEYMARKRRPRRRTRDELLDVLAFILFMKEWEKGGPKPL